MPTKEECAVARGVFGNERHVVPWWTRRAAVRPNGVRDERRLIRASAGTTAAQDPDACPSCPQVGRPASVRTERNVICTHCTMMEYNWDQYGNERLLSRNKLLFVHHQQAHDILLRHLATLDTAVPVLDIGCGDGFYLEMFRNLGFTNLAGLDPSASQISKAREKNLPVTIGRVEDLENTGHPLCSKSYGIILLWDLLEHVEHPDRALQIAHTLLAPGGSLVVNTVVNDSVWSRLRRFLKKETRLQQTQRVDPSHIVAFTKKSAEMLVLQAGFRILQSMRIGNRWPYFSKKNFRWLSRWTVFGLFGDALTLIAVR